MKNDTDPGPLELRAHPVLRAPEGPVVLLILDGVGVGAGDEFDAVSLARTPNLDLLRSTGQATSLRAHGTAVGLPSDADIGNSEVGHNIMGAGRVFDQGAKLVDRAIETGTLWDGHWKTLVQGVRCRRRRVAPHGAAFGRQRPFPRGSPARVDPPRPPGGAAPRLRARLAGRTRRPGPHRAGLHRAPGSAAGRGPRRRRRPEEARRRSRAEAARENPAPGRAATTASPPAAAGWW